MGTLLQATSELNQLTTDIPSNPWLVGWLVDRQGDW